MKYLIRSWITCYWVLILCPKVPEVYYLLSDDLYESIFKPSNTHGCCRNVSHVTYVSVSLSSDLEVPVSSSLNVREELHKCVGY